MAAEVNEALTRKVADLARLEVTPDEVTQFTSRLNQILKYVDQLMDADVTGVEPMVSPLDMPTPLRPDIPNPFPTDAEGKPKVLTAAPEVLYEGYKVPPII